MVLNEPRMIKAYVHPTRISILRILATKKMTVSHVARILKVHPANITHHFRLLQKTGLIVLVEKRDIGQNIEKYYRSVARNFVVNLDRSRKFNKKALALTFLRDHLSSGIRAVKERENQKIIALIRTVKVRPDDIELLQNKIAKILKEFTQLHTQKGTAYTMNISVYPNERELMGREEIIIGE